MRIGMILDNTFPPDPRVENEAISLIKKGHEVLLFCLKYGPEPTDEIHQGIQVKRYPSNQWLYKLSALAYTVPLYTFLMARKIRHFIQAHAIEVVHIHDMQIGAAVFRAIKKNPLPTVLDLHENRPEIMRYYPHLQSFLGKRLISLKKWKQQEETLVKKADYVLTVTEEAGQELIERTDKPVPNVIAVPNTVRKTFYEDARPLQSLLKRYNSYFTLLYIGDTGLRRGLQTAIGAVARLKDRIPEIRLVVVGRNTTDKVLRAQVARFNIAPWVDFQGWQPEALFPSYIAASTVCISPLHRNPHHDTTYANKICQYMSMGKPLLVSDATAQKQLVERVGAGLVHRATDQDDFAKKVAQLYTDQMLAKQLGDNGRRFISQKFHWEKTSEKLIALYQNISR